MHTPGATRGLLGFYVNDNNVSLKNSIASQKLPTSLVTPAFHEKKMLNHIFLPSHLFEGSELAMEEGTWILSSLHPHHKFKSQVQVKLVITRSPFHP